jgi:hypothetical protein
MNTNFVSNNMKRRDVRLLTSTLLPVVFSWIKFTSFLMLVLAIGVFYSLDKKNTIPIWTYVKTGEGVAGFELITLVVIGTDYTGSNNSIYHTITTTHMFKLELCFFYPDCKKHRSLYCMLFKRLNGHIIYGTICSGIIE